MPTSRSGAEGCTFAPRPRRATVGWISLAQRFGARPSSAPTATAAGPRSSMWRPGRSGRGLPRPLPQVTIPPPADPAARDALWHEGVWIAHER
jgi:hypothetical protein